MASFYVNLTGQTERDTLESTEVTRDSKEHYRRLLRSTRCGLQREHLGLIYLAITLMIMKKEIQHAISGHLLCGVWYECFL